MAWPGALTSQCWVSISSLTNKRPRFTGFLRFPPTQIHSPTGMRNFMTGAWVRRPTQGAYKLCDLRQVT